MVQVSCRASRGWLGFVVLALVTRIPVGVAAQAEFVVSGQLYDAGSNGSVQNAIVTLEGHGAVLSNGLGTFTFQNVPPGSYALNVRAFGYLDLNTSVTVVEDTNLSISLDPDPLLLDSITVEVTTFDFDGRVRDPARDTEVMDAEILSNQGHEEWSNLYGRFDLDDVFEHIPIRLAIRAFGYLPLDTTFVPDGEERYPFDLVEDEVMTRLIAVQAARLEERAPEHRYKHTPSLNRDDMARFMDNGTLQIVMEWTYPPVILRSVGCFIFDEREIDDVRERRNLLENTPAKALERVELFEFPGGRRLVMVRVYTRDFFMRHVGSDQPMRVPNMQVGGVCR